MEGTVEFMTGDTNHTSRYTETQEKSVSDEYASCERDADARNSGEMGKEISEGDRLDQVLAGHGMNRSRLAAVSGVGATTLQGWYNALQKGTITDKVWGKLARALQAAGIDPKEVRPSAAVPGKTKPEEVMPALLDIIQRRDRAMLTLALELLTVEDPGSRFLLVSLVRSAIDKL